MSSTACDAQYAFISKDGSCNSNAEKLASGPNDMCGGGYTYGASVGKPDCSSSSAARLIKRRV
jgi:hypothetical protein